MAVGSNVGEAAVSYVEDGLGGESDAALQGVDRAGMKA